MFYIRARLRGKKLLSISVPRSLMEDYGIAPGDYVKITLEVGDEVIEFAKAIAKTGVDGAIIYIPKRITEAHNLEHGMAVVAKLQYIEEVV